MPPIKTKCLSKIECLCEIKNETKFKCIGRINLFGKIRNLNCASTLENTLNITNN